MTAVSLLPAFALGAGATFAALVFWAFWRSCKASTATWSDLVVDHATGRASQTKVWAHIGNAAMTGLLIKVCWNATAGEGVAGLFFVYGGIVAGSHVASRIITAKYSGAAPTSSTTERVERVEERKTTVATTAASAAHPGTGGNDAPKP